MTDLSGLTVAVLAGGLGTRLRSVVADRPKVLADIHGRPFLAYLLDQLAGAGCRCVVLCTGYLGEQVSRVFGRSYGPLEIRYSQEQEPRGTGGALKLAIENFNSDPVLVMNGDSFCGIDLKAYWNWHCRQQATASVALTRVMRNERYGLVKLDSGDRIVEFSEKKTGGEGWINAGIYFLSQELLRAIPKTGSVSLERDIFPQWVGRGLYGYRGAAPFLDIGTPEDFGVAENFFARLRLNESPRRRFVVLDRDGTIIQECEYLSDPEQVTLIPGAGTALSELQRMGFGLAVITNQSGVGRGFFDLDRVNLIHQRLERLLATEGVRLDGLYVCPHTPDDDCACRKPRLGLIRQASSELDFDLKESIVIGDKPCDIEMGRIAGATTFLVRTGYGVQFENAVTADFVVDDLTAATRLIRSRFCEERTSLHGY
jgi:histidinol-phosphate phosphatase family protein